MLSLLFVCPTFLKLRKNKLEPFREPMSVCKYLGYRLFFIADCFRIVSLTVVNSYSFKPLTVIYVIYTCA